MLTPQLILGLSEEIVVEYLQQFPHGVTGSATSTAGW